MSAWDPIDRGALGPCAWWGMYWKPGAEGRALTFFAHTQAALQLRQRDDLVLVQVTVVSESPGALLGLGFLLHVALEGLHLPLVDVVAAVAVQLAEVPVHHSLLQGVAGIRLREPGPQADPRPQRTRLRMPQGPTAPPDSPGGRRQGTRGGCWQPGRNGSPGRRLPRPVWPVVEPSHPLQLESPAWMVQLQWATLII